MSTSEAARSGGAAQKQECSGAAISSIFGRRVPSPHARRVSPLRYQDADRQVPARFSRAAYGSRRYPNPPILPASSGGGYGRASRRLRGLILDDIDEAGNTRRAGALPLRMREELFANAPVRGDIVTVRGHFDDPLAATCEATGPDGTAGMIDLRFLVLYCREQFVVEEITVVGHRDLAPAWWEQPSDDWLCASDRLRLRNLQRGDHSIEDFDVGRSSPGRTEKPPQSRRTDPAC